MANKIEKERRWLLKRLPNLQSFTKVEHIAQFYTSDGWRYRLSENQMTGEQTCVRLKKIPMTDGINHEIDIEDVTEKQLEKVALQNTTVKWIEKERFTTEYKGKTFEIDEFEDLNLVILEVEDVELNDDIEFPEEVKVEIITEITGQSAFSNFNLAEYVSKEQNPV